MSLFKNLCTPAYFYLILSSIFLVISSIQNYGNVDTYCLGQMSCTVPNTLLIFLLKVIYVLFWTWILNLICGAGYSGVSWFLVLLPFILLFLLIIVFLFNPITK